MALPSGSFLKSQTALQQLLEEINFQRTKEMRQLLKDDSGFVVLQGTTYWTDLFVRHFLFQSEPVHNIDSDDLLFFVRKKHVKGSSRHMPKYETEVDVYRKDSRKLPIGDPDVDWEETVYLNMVIHQFDYTLTLAICTRTSPKELQVLRRHSQRVYASPSRRKMDTKGEGEEMTYPHICFMVDNFDEVFSDILVRDGEMVCVELVASDKDGSVQGVIFLGSIRYDALKKVYDARQSSLSSKVAQRMTFGLFSSGAGVQTRCEFVRMKGPQGKGHAEMAVTKPKGSGVETPTSEPGFCATDMWDEWDDEDDYTYRHQRRLSDPSANLNNFTRYGWRTKHTDGSAGAKARSENEGLDSLASEVSEIEAGDLRDDRPASSASETKLNAATTISPPTCCNCFKRRSSCCNKRWSESGSAQMSDVYCRACDDDAAAADSPSCLNRMPNRKTKPKHRTLLNVESELVLSDNKSKSSSSSLSSSSSSKKDKKDKKDKKNSIPKKDRRSLNEEKLLKNRRNSISSCSSKDSKKRLSLNGTNNNEKIQEYELADDAISLNGDTIPRDDVVKIGILSEKDSKLMISVHGEEELPVVEQTTTSATVATVIMNGENNCNSTTIGFRKCVPIETKSHPLEPIVVINQELNSVKTKKIKKNENDKNKSVDDNVDDDDDDDNNIEEEEEDEEITVKLKLLGGDCNGNDVKHENGNGEKASASDDDFKTEIKTSTLPRTNKKTSVYQNFYNKAMRMVPKRTTPDGTNIYYWCDLPKKALKELDDGAYNPLWATRGFTQTFHFWKENRRQQSTPLNAFLTYVTLPWWSIAKDLLDHRETPILTF